MAAKSNNEVIRSLREHGKEGKAALDNRIALRWEVLKSRYILVLSSNEGRSTGALDDETSLDGQFSQLHVSYRIAIGPLE